MTSNKRTSSSLIPDEIETKKLKTDSPSPRITTTTTTAASKESIPSFIDDNISPKKACSYGADCYRQGNPKHTAEYTHPCNWIYFKKIEYDIEHSL